MPKRYYIAYGSNLNVTQMRFRCPSARIIGISEIPDYQLLFKGSKTGSYLTIEPCKGAVVPVAAWEVSEQDELQAVFEKVYRTEGPVVCEWPQDPNQVIEPRVMNRKSEDGCIVSTPIDDLAPFLSTEEYKEMQFPAWRMRQ